MILYGETVGGEIISAGHTGADAQGLQDVLEPVHDALLSVTSASGPITITIHGVPEDEADGTDENGTYKTFPLYGAGQYDALREFLKRDRSAVGAAGHVIE